MDSTARIEAYKTGLRLKYPATASGIAALRAKIAELMDDETGAAHDSVAITQQSFEGANSAGTLVLEPLAKLQAMTDVLREIDPDFDDSSAAPTTHADFSYSPLQT